jgi:hypothetical protein
MVLVVYCFRCESCKGCTRTNLPLVCGKADTIHSLQGLTVGPGEAMTHMVLHWDEAAESLWPGVFYVGASRAKEASSIALEGGFSMKAQVKVKGAEDMQAEVHRITVDAQDSAGGSNPDEFFTAMRWLIETARSKQSVPLDVQDQKGIESRRSVMECLEQWQESLEILASHVR